MSRKPKPAPTPKQNKIIAGLTEAIQERMNTAMDAREAGIAEGRSAMQAEMDAELVIGFVSLVLGAEPDAARQTPVLISAPLARAIARTLRRKGIATGNDRFVWQAVEAPASLATTT